MRYVYYELSNGYFDCEEFGVMTFDDTDTDEMINRILQAELNLYGSTYEHLSDHYNILMNCWDKEEDEENYYNNLIYSWKEISKEEYNKFLFESIKK